MTPLSFLLTALSDAYLQVGVWVAAMVWLCGWLRERPGSRFTRLLLHPRFAPWIGALLGVTPGCGGAVVVMPLYVSGATSFGAVVATLVATMGDSSFVMLAAQPKLGLLLHASLFVFGGLCGTLVDTLNLAPRRRPPARSWTTPIPRLTKSPCSVGAMRIGSGLLYRPDSALQGVLLLLFLLPILAGLVIAIAIAFFRVDPMVLGTIGNRPLVQIFGSFGAVQLLALVVLAKLIRRPKGQVYAKKPRGLAIEALHETAPVVFWVALSFLATSILVDGLGLDLSFLKEQELWAVCIGACIGLIPGCGPQIVLTGLYIDGIVGLPVLVANAISQDGDALLPLLSKDPSAATRATLLTTIPALFIGIIAWALTRNLPTP